jgi:hypothetical protein
LKGGRVEDVTEGEGCKWGETGGLKGAHKEGILRPGNVFMVFGGIVGNVGAFRGSVERGVRRGWWTGDRGAKLTGVALEWGTRESDEDGATDEVGSTLGKGREEDGRTGVIDETGISPKTSKGVGEGREGTTEGGAMLMMSWRASLGWGIEWAMEGKTRRTGGV